VTMVQVHLHTRKKEHVTFVSSAPFRRVFVELYIGGVYKNLSRKSSFGYNRTKTSGTLYEDLSTYYCFRRTESAIKAKSSSEITSGF
jgi:hypothetical protein